MFSIPSGKVVEAQGDEMETSRWWAVRASTVSFVPADQEWRLVFPCQVVLRGCGVKQEVFSVQRCGYRILLCRQTQLLVRLSQQEGEAGCFAPAWKQERSKRDEAVGHRESHSGHCGQGDRQAISRTRWLYTAMAKSPIEQCERK